ncbi:FAD-dependent thymidylate synthase [Ruminococcus sp.]|uniref:FAD-dependent thymidylate synthase n=1 Tax=Ruminococcus sp. TaxID=41978 RepID=UPI0025FBF73B|nr:FAD-dependent thymidylate synthase [Ruminococcus sp.]MCI5815707.1 FAD-dependent thymidylate synthase [Ruminococcus sp.]
MEVTLLGYTPVPEKMIAAAAKLCYSDSGAMDLMDGLDEEKTAHFMEMLTNIGHESPIEHASFTFAIEGVSRSLLAQITRHRIASFSVQSQRYVKKSSFVYITPPAIAEDPQAKAVFEESMAHAFAAYNQLADQLEQRYLQENLRAGMTEKAARSKAEKKAIEDARFVLPNACETKMMVTMNARSLYHFFRLRCCRRAQWEIRELAMKMLRLCCQAAPMLFANAGPGCCSGPCPEGKMSCGAASEVRSQVEALRHE